MNLPKRIILTVYLAVVVYCCTWIPWCENHTNSATYRSHTYYRIGYGWIWAGPRVLVEEPDPSAARPSDAAKRNQESGWTVVGEESTHIIVKGGLSYAQPDVRLIVLRLIAVTAFALAALLVEGIMRRIRLKH